MFDFYIECCKQKTNRELLQVGMAFRQLRSHDAFVVVAESVVSSEHLFEAEEFDGHKRLLQYMRELKRQRLRNDAVSIHIYCKLDYFSH